MRVLPRYSIVFCVLAAITCLLLIWYAPLSGDFIVRALLIGGLAGLLSHSWLSSQTDWVNISTLTLILMVLTIGGFYWSRDHAFGSLYPTGSGPILFAQYLTAMTATCLLSFGLLRYAKGIGRKRSH